MKFNISNFQPCLFADGAIVLLDQPLLNAVEVKFMITVQLPKIFAVHVILLQMVFEGENDLLYSLSSLKSKELQMNN